MSELIMILCRDCGGENGEHEPDCPEQAANLNAIHPEYLRGRSHEATESEAELSALRQPRRSAIDERNIARKESTALAGQLATVTKERDEAQAYVMKLADIAADLGTERMVLRQRVTELEAALGGLMPFVMEEYHPDYATPDFKAAVERALAATAPDAQSGTTP